MIGIILAGGSGSRLYPNTHLVSKQLLPIYSSPLLYYTLVQMMNMDIKEIIVITNTHNVKPFQKLLKDGSQWGINIKVLPQDQPKGIAEAFLIAEPYIKGRKSLLMLGDNIFHGYNFFKRDIKNFEEGCVIYSYRVSDPQRYGVVEFGDKDEVLSIEEKPVEPRSNYAAVGLYLVDSTVIRRTRELKPSERGELEITDVMKSYLSDEKLYTKKLNRGTVWLDAGTVESLAEATNFVETIEKRSGIKIACPEEVAYKQKFITKQQLKNSLNDMPNCDYKDYILKDVL